MAGQAGYEFLGDYADGEFVKDALLAADQEFGLVQVGAQAYATNGVESGWIPSPTPGIYSDPSLAEYRQWLSLFSFEGQKPLHGSGFSAEIEDYYYVSHWELAYGRSISFNHDFLGRDALQAAQDNVPRTKITLELAWGEHPGGAVDPDADLGFRRIRATVQPSPYNEYARTKYRADAAPA